MRQNLERFFAPNGKRLCCLFPPRRLALGAKKALLAQGGKNFRSENSGRIYREGHGKHANSWRSIRESTLRRAEGTLIHFSLIHFSLFTKRAPYGCMGAVGAKWWEDVGILPYGVH